MTYEEKMLEIFSRYRGQTLSSEVVAAIQEVCEKEVWCHLPVSVLRQWRLRLALNSAGGIELRPSQLTPGGSEELEAALSSQFVERDQAPTPGGIAGISMNFTGDLSRTPIQTVHSGSVSTSPTALSASDSATKDDSPERSESSRSAAEIAAQASALGISMPPNSSLLGPFLEALSAAIEYKNRAEKAEAILKQLGQLANS